MKKKIVKGLKVTLAMTLAACMMAGCGSSKATQAPQSYDGAATETAQYAPEYEPEYAPTYSEADYTYNNPTPENNEIVVNVATSSLVSSKYEIYGVSLEASKASP